MHETPNAPVDARPALLDLLPKVLPELGLVAASLAAAIAPAWLPPVVGQSLQAIVLVEVLFCMAQASLTDIATRLRKAPPVWLGVLILAGLAVMNPEVARMVIGMFREGWMVFLPFAWSLVERGRELWTMPRASSLEKYRRRALVSGRISIVLVVAGTFLAATAIRAIRSGMGPEFEPIGPHTYWWLVLAFSLSSFDVLRVHLPAFERRPRALFGRLDPMGVRDLSPL
jgi:hypothetical protein